EKQHFQVAIFLHFITAIYSKQYRDIRMRITSTVKNGISSQAGNLNASVPAFMGGTYNLEPAKGEVVSKMNYLYETKGKDGITTGSNRFITIPLQVYGATDQTKIGLEDLKIELIDGVDESGKVVPFNLIQEVKGMKDSIVTSKQRFYPIFRNSWSEAVYPYELMIKETPPYPARMRQLGIAITLNPLKIRNGIKDNFSRYLGVSVPEGDVEINFKQKISKIKHDENLNHIGSWQSLNLEEDIKPTEIFDYGDPERDYKNNQTVGTYRQLRRSLYVPAARNNNNLNSVYDSGKQKITETSGGDFKLSFSNYKVDSNHVPINGIAGNINDAALKNFFLFLSVGTYLKEDITLLTDNIALRYSYNVDSIWLRGTAEEELTENFGQLYYNEISYKYPLPTISVYSKYLDAKGNGSLGSSINTLINTGNEVLTAGAEFVAVTAIGVSSNFWAKDSVLMQKWNPEESEFISVSKTDPELLEGDNKIAEPKPIEYGVSRSGKYDYATLNKNRMADYVWYSKVEEAQANGKLSAIRSGSVGQRKGAQYENLFVRRRLKKSSIGDRDKFGNSFATLGWAKMAWEEDGSKSTQYPSTQSWFPSEYDENGVVSQQSDFIFGNNVLIVPAKVSYAKSINEYQTNKPKKLFRSSEKATVEVKPVLKTDDETQVEKEFTLKEVLPKGMRYELGSARFNKNVQEPEVEEVAGETTLTWKLKGKTNVKIPPLTYNVYFVQGDLKFNTSGTTELSSSGIVSMEGANTNSRLRTDEVSLTLVREDKWEIDHQVSKKEWLPIEAKQEITYQIKVSNQLKQDLTNINILDVLPEDKDTLGSKFKGNYKIKRMNYFKADQKTPYTGQVAGYVTNDPIDRGTNPNDVNLTNWTAYNQELAQGKAVFVNIAKLAPAESFYIHLTLEVSGSKAGDAMRNRVVGNSKAAKLEGLVQSQVQEVTWDYPKVTMSLKRKLKTNATELEPIYDLDQEKEEVQAVTQTVKRQDGQTFAEFIHPFKEMNFKGYTYLGYQVKVGDKIFDGNLDEIPLENFEVTLLYLGSLDFDVTKDLNFGSQRLLSKYQENIPLQKQEGVVPKLSVTNTLGSTSTWFLSVRQKTPLRNIKEEKLLGELIYRKKPNEKGLVLSKDLQPIKSSVTPTQIYTDVPLLQEEVSQEGVYLNLGTGNLAGTFSGELLWSLDDKPTP
ncbi:hypothetical protein, partial [Vagococcus sp.]|uniref:hypothetical protein n=1 Tax=Vagococcus sp. TaxID=1933889 RepID=UPI003F99FC7C